MKAMMILICLLLSLTTFAEEDQQQAPAENPKFNSDMAVKAGGGAALGGGVIAQDGVIKKVQTETGLKISDPNSTKLFLNNVNVSKIMGEVVSSDIIDVSYFDGKTGKATYKTFDLTQEGELQRLRGQLNELANDKAKIGGIRKFSGKDAVTLRRSATKMKAGSAMIAVGIGTLLFGIASENSDAKANKADTEALKKAQEESKW